MKTEESKSSKENISTQHVPMLDPNAIDTETVAILSKRRPYRYLSKADRGLPHLTVRRILYKIVTTGSTSNVIEESVATKMKTREDKPVLNPLLQQHYPHNHNQEKMSHDDRIIHSHIDHAVPHTHTSTRTSARVVSTTLREKLIKSTNEDDGVAVTKITSMQRKSSKIIQALGPPLSSNHTASTSNNSIGNETSHVNKHISDFGIVDTCSNSGDLQTSGAIRHVATTHTDTSIIEITEVTMSKDNVLSSKDLDNSK